VGKRLSGSGKNKVRKIGNLALGLEAHYTTNIEGTQSMPE
jgi:hypothetical protein